MVSVREKKSKKAVCSTTTDDKDVISVGGYRAISSTGKKKKATGEKSAVSIGSGKNRLVASRKMCISCGTDIPAKSMRCFSCHANQPVNVLDCEQPVVKDKKARAYTRYRVTMEHDLGEDEAPLVYDKIIFKLKDKSLINQLSPYVPLTYTPHKKKQITFVGGRDLVVALPKLEAILTSGMKVSPLIESLIEYVRDLDIRMRKQFDYMLEHDRIVFDGLWYLFESGSQATARHNDQLIGFTIKSATYGGGLISDNFTVNGITIRSDGKWFFTKDHTIHVHEYASFNLVDSLPIAVMDKSSRRLLKKRGKTYVKLAKGHHYMQYHGALTSVSFGSWKVKANGRVMIDIETFKKHNPSNTADWSVPNEYSVDQNQVPVFALKEVNKDECFMCWHSLPGFSFKTKTWGTFLVSRISEVAFDKKAFNRLVLPADKKSLIAALVEDHRRNTLTIKEQERAQEEMLSERFDRAKKPKHQRKAEKRLKQLKKEKEEIEAAIEHHDQKPRKKGKDFVDIIAGKGGGCIFLLHGSPGTGKTLTAEAVSEHLRVPLYIVTVSELGCTPSALEKSLQSVLELAATWGCAILLDEADIFLEARAASDITRNAMVGVFLRLLEYHQGVLFLTTNRIRCIDEAFSSRISVALHYTELDSAARTQVWKNFLLIAAGDDGSEAASTFDFDLLGSYELNGRQIRSCVRIGQSLARNEGKELSMEQLHTTINVCLNFRSQFFDIQRNHARKMARLAACEDSDEEETRGRSVSSVRSGIDWGVQIEQAEALGFEFED